MARLYSLALSVLGREYHNVKFKMYKDFRIII